MASIPDKPGGGAKHRKVAEARGEGEPEKTVLKTVIEPPHVPDHGIDEIPPSLPDSPARTATGEIPPSRDWWDEPQPTVHAGAISACVATVGCGGRGVGGGTVLR